MRLHPTALALLALVVMSMPGPAVAQSTDVIAYIVCLSSTAEKLQRASPNMHEDDVLDFAFKECILYEAKAQEWVRENYKGDAKENISKFKKTHREMLRSQLKKSRK